MVDPALTGRITGDMRKYWWLFLIRGLAGLALGVLAVMFPGITLGVAVLLIGAYLVVDGVLTIAKAVQVVRSDSHWWVLLLEGILSLAVGIAIFAWPGLSVLTMAFLVGYWAIFTGVLAIVTAMRLRVHMPGEWLYMLFAIISIIFGCFVLYQPLTGLVYLVLMIAIYGFVMGVTMIALAFRIRSLPAP